MTVISPTPAGWATRYPPGAPVAPGAPNTPLAPPAPVVALRRGPVSVSGVGTAVQVLLTFDVVLLLADIAPALRMRDVLAALPAGVTSVTFDNPEGSISAFVLLTVGAVLVTLVAAVTAIVWACRVAGNVREFRAQGVPPTRSVRPLAVVWAVLVAALAAWCFVWPSAPDLRSAAWAVPMLPFVLLVPAIVTAVLVRRVGHEHDKRIAAQWRRW